MKNKDNDWGKEGEKLAAEHLLRNGYTIREINYSPNGSHKEVDIIAEIPGIICFVEVKTRTPYRGDDQWENDPTVPAQAVDMKKMRRIARVAHSYLQSIEYPCEYRFDIITIVGTPTKHILTHITDAFLAPYSSR